MVCVTVGLNGNGFCYRKLCVLSFKPSHCFSKSPKARRDFLQAFGDNKHVLVYFSNFFVNALFV